MAIVQAGASGGKLILLIGAGVTGSYLLRDTHLSDLLSDLTKVLTKHLRDHGDDEGGGGDSDATAALTAQVRRLAQELRQLASASGRPIVVHADNRGSGGFFSALLPLAAVGAAGYGYMWWKGWKFGDLMYVTKKGMANMVESVKGQMEGLAGALAATKRQISNRLDGVTKTMNDHAALTGEVKQEVGELKADLGLVQADLGLVRRDVGYLTGDVQDMRGQLQNLETKQDFTNQGIILLCRFVVGGLQGNPKPELVQGLHAYTRGAMTRSVSVPAAVPANAGLKLVQELEGLVEKIETSQSSPSLLAATEPVTHTRDEMAVPSKLPPKPGLLTRSGSARR